MIATTALHVAPFAGTGDEWDSFVRQQPDWTHFHLFGWRDVISDVFRHECPYLAARAADGTIVGALPLVRVRSVLFGHYLVSMPFLNYGGPLGSAAARRALIEAAEGMAERDDVKLLQLRSGTEQPTELEVSHHKVTVLIDIPEAGPDALWKQLPHKMRTKIRKPQKAGVEVRFGPEQLEPFYRILATNMRDLGTPVQSRRFYEAIRDAFGDTVWFGVAYHEGRPVSGGCGFVWRDEMEITWSSSLRGVSEFRPGYLLHWAFFERAAREGCRIGNFGRSTPGSGTHAYKQQWGGRDQPLYWYHRAKGSRTHTPSPDDGAYAWGPRIWRHLPVYVATKLGPMIVCWIP